MTTMFRTSGGGMIDRNKPLNFIFDGETYRGFAGDTLASALLANGVHLMGRSFKYHRPRGLIAAGAEEPNALVSVDRGQSGKNRGRITPNLRATQVELYDGLIATSQNRWPSLGFDLGAVNDLAPSGLLSAGFYYKTFMAPASAWHTLYDPLIRRAAGLGTAPSLPDPDHYTHLYAFCDVAIIGAGPAGLAAALAESEGSLRVILCDEQPEFGGSLQDERTALIDGQPAAQWARDAIRQLEVRGNVTLLRRTQAFGYYAQNFLGLAERLTDHLGSIPEGVPRERLWKVRAKRVVLATGAIERPLVFPDNDRPGIMLASAAVTFANRYGVKPGSYAAILAADDSGYRAALDLVAAGVSVAVIADPRPAPSGPGLEAARKAGLRIETATTITATTGRKRVSSATLGLIGPNGAVISGRTVSCDLVLMAGGWTPSVHLL